MHDVFLLSLAFAEMVGTFKVLSRSMARLSERCEDSKLRCFETVFDGFDNTGHDPYVWILSWKEMEAKMKMERYVAATATLHCEIDEREWREALGKILDWLLPLAHNMMKWQHERSFEHQNVIPKIGVLLLQTLFFADQKKTEAAITELLVGLNYIWRFDNAKAFLNCTNFKNVQQQTN
ncbi:hypothetical protein E3N88_12758 [Mikania micrantha]|uniref:DUF668 domain-containing protein n=1 Tax=Mikania micrantha TaxID=192012 RepID=A0A5N6P7R7_9ASTR|nr:hypothetical protein E3N88_12758 [Mikania micrantha]